MVYSFELIKHANIRYRDAVKALSLCELQAMLRSLSLSSEIAAETLGGSVFLSFECRELTREELLYLAGHSSVSLMAEQKDGWLRPLSVLSRPYLPEDLPEILKYKGKTGVPFTRMMINTALALTPRSHTGSTPVFFDPVCGKATGCFCALTAGMNAVGIDLDRKDLNEASSYFERYLRIHRLKHESGSRSETFGKKPVPVTEIVFADTKEHYQEGQVRRLTLACADTSASPALFRRSGADIIVADLPYGVQHAPLSGARPESLTGFLHRVLPVWKSVIKPGGAVALSFNTLTLPASQVADALSDAGFVLQTDPCFTSLRHEVEQAVVRDVVFALYPEEESSNDSERTE